MKSRSALPVRKWFPQPRSNNLLHTFPLAGDLAEGLDGSSTHGTSDPIYNPVEIHLQYLPDVVPLARAWNHTGLSDGGEPQAGSSRPLPGLQHIARASLEVGQGQSLEVAKQKLPTSERILYQVVERPYQKPRRCVRRGLVHQEYVEVREGQPGKPRHERQAEVRLEP